MERFIFKIAGDEKELEDYFRLRREVFVSEQGIFSETDVDEFDADPFHKVIHIVSVKLPEREVVGAVECYRIEGDTWVGGRLSARSRVPERARRHGAREVRRADDEGHGRVPKVPSYVQPQNVRFFQRLGWTPIETPRNITVFSPTHGG
ncbi:MAG: hypothetical protein R3B51_02460 [Thermodesulfobacteriota bacterium]